MSDFETACGAAGGPSRVQGVPGRFSDLVLRIAGETELWDLSLADADRSGAVDAAGGAVVLRSDCGRQSSGAPCGGHCLLYTSDAADE